MRKRITILTVVALVASVPGLSYADAFGKTTFPRLGGYQIGATPYDGYSDPEYISQMARLDYVIIGQSQPEATDVARSVKRLNPQITLAKYTNILDISVTAQNFNKERRAKLFAEKGPNNSNAHDWWARDFDGNQSSNWPGNWMANITKYVKPDANGDRFPEWAAKQYYELWMSEDVWDAWFEDVAFYVIRKTASGKPADWSGGQESNIGWLNVAFRQGHQAYWNEIRRLTPNKPIFVNHDWYFNRPENLLEYTGQVDGGLLEIVMKSKDLNGGGDPWSVTMEHYRISFDFMRKPTMMMFVVQGEPDNYRFMRYTLATCLMNDGYFEYVPLKFYYGTVEWFDEFDLAGTAKTDWMGAALDSPRTSSWKSGVWRRDFAGGIALVNPKGNGQRTVAIEKGFRRINGNQDRSVNNGQPVTSVTLLDGDGIILVRDGTVTTVIADPKSPELDVN
jgi:hypothetical protein